MACCGVSIQVSCPVFFWVYNFTGWYEGVPLICWTWAFCGLYVSQIYLPFCGMPFYSFNHAFCWKKKKNHHNVAQYISVFFMTSYFFVYPVYKLLLSLVHKDILLCFLLENILLNLLFYFHFLISLKATSNLFLHFSGDVQDLRVYPTYRLKISLLSFHECWEKTWHCCLREKEIYYPQQEQYAEFHVASLPYSISLGPDGCFPMECTVL